MERRYLKLDLAGVRLEKRGDGDAAKEIITGYAAVFYSATEAGTQYDMQTTWANFSERVMPGAFDRALREMDDCRALVNHDPNLLLGRTKSGTCRLSVDGRGLRYEVDPPDTQAGRDCRESIRRGDMDGSSFSFEVQDEDWEEGKKDGKSYSVRCIRSVKLYDVSPVTFPAYTATTTGFRAEGDIEEAKASWLRHLDRQMGEYRRRAKAVEVAMAMEG